VGQRCACHDADYAGRWRPLSRIMATDSIHTVVCYCPVCGALAMQLLLIHLQYFERHIAICVWDLTYGSTCMAVVSRCITLCNVHPAGTFCLYSLSGTVLADSMFDMSGRKKSNQWLHWRSLRCVFVGLFNSRSGENSVTSRQWRRQDLSQCGGGTTERTSL